jgi:hypothetical protein
VQKCSGEIDAAVLGDVAAACPRLARISMARNAMGSSTLPDASEAQAALDAAVGSAGVWAVRDRSRHDYGEIVWEAARAAGSVADAAVAAAGGAGGST